jgi:hypothetical protein
MQIDPAAAMGPCKVVDESYVFWLSTFRGVMDILIL